MDQVEVMQECDACEKLLCKLLDVGTWERHEAVRFEEIEYALPVEVCNNADMIPEVEAISQVDTTITIGAVVAGEGGKNTEFDLRCIAVFLNRADDFNSATCASAFVVGFDYFAKRTLAKQTDNVVCL